MSAPTEGTTRERLARLRVTPLMPGLLAVGLMLVWTVQNGGYDASTWYWGALVLLATLAAVVLGPSGHWAGLSRPAAIALGAFGLYVAWSYLSIIWAKSPGDALEGSNRALLYLLAFALLGGLPWTAESALAALCTFVVGLGVIALVMLFRLADAERVQDIVVGGRMIAPTGYFNTSVGLFMIDALVATALAARRELPAPVRGLLLALATASLQLAVVGESRGWLFTLPFVLVASLAVVRERTRFLMAAAVPVAATLGVLHVLLNVYRSRFVSTALDHAATRAGRTSLLLCGCVLVAGTALAWADNRIKPSSVSRRTRRLLSAGVVSGTIAAGCLGAITATHGDPVGFMKRQWHGFTHLEQQTASASYFETVGTGRYDFWRVSLDALRAHPLGGLGQDNFAEYYLRRGRTGEEPAWTHSLEMRLLAHTGAIGFALFAVFLIAAVATALHARRKLDEYAGWVSGAALLPLVVWLIHGSLDWFWEVPALSGPALGFLGVSIALSRRPPRDDALSATVNHRRHRLLVAAVIVLVGAGTFVLGFPYLSAREISAASEVRQSVPQQALNRLSTAAQLDPLSATPGRLGGAIALQSGRFTEAEKRFHQSIARDPGGWFAWLGDGLAATQLGDLARARQDFEVALSITRTQPAISAALSQLRTKHPLSVSAAFQLLVLHH